MEELEEFVLAEDAPVPAADELEDLFGVIDAGRDAEDLGGRNLGVDHENLEDLFGLNDLNDDSLNDDRDVEELEDF